LSSQDRKAAQRYVFGAAAAPMVQFLQWRTASDGVEEEEDEDPPFVVVVLVGRRNDYSLI